MKIKVKIGVLILVVLLLGSWYAIRACERRQGELVDTYPSADGMYIAEIYMLRDPVLDYDFLYEVRILDQSGELVKTSTAFNGSLNLIFWDCPREKCIGFFWGFSEEHYVGVPPTRLDRVLAKLP